MDEYFCPNCGAILNEQSGFDPDNSTWVCTECGKLLMDDDTYEGDNYEGVAWFCDQCGALLNKQSGFSDYYSTWTCTECYHVNSISEDEIYESEEDYQKSKNSMEQSSCSDSQENYYSYDRYDDDDDEYDDDEDDEYDDEEEEEYLTNFSSYGVNYEPETTIEKKPISELRKKRLKAFFFNRKKISIGVSSDELVGEDVVQVKTILENAAFNNVKIVPVKDIYTDNYHKTGAVDNVSIAGVTKFDGNVMFPYDAEVVITYHMKREIKLPCSYRNLKKLKFQEAVDMLIDFGYTEVHGKQIEDLVTGWLKKDGTIDNITFAGSENIEKNKLYEYDVEIVITYHTFKKKK